MAKPKADLKPWAESVAIQALTYLAEDPERLGRFLALSGLGPASIRVAAQDPEFLIGVLDHVVGNEAMLIEFARSLDLLPQDIEKAHAALAGPRWQRDVP
jgi:hypothetical protein